ncbi:radical SAM family heme chaperone HemW [Clostridium botulinum]|uniref:Heme chaperone HemW n=1 Tax=Clostridium botulinum TaxID=1491 RepID=A0A6M0SSW7_CLOBO|nr:radical SAM family heme chaperone HemW [Clostridium botulinum]
MSIKNKKSIYDIYDWRDTICVSHYPFPTEVVDSKGLSNLIGLDVENHRKEAKVLYVHIPFCDKICSFCPFNKILKKEELVEKYITAIKNEIDSYSNTKYFKTSRFSAINIGGGTPSSLKSEQLMEIITHIKNKFNLEEDVVISVEGNTSNFTEEKLSSVFKVGVNRISFGIQTFNQKLRDIMGLKETSERCLQLLNNARKIGFKNIGIDLIYNLPGQSMEDWIGDIETAINNNIDHITTFALCMVPGTKLQKQIISGDVPSVGHQNDEIDMFCKARELLRKAGYIQYSIWDFAKPGKIDKNPLIYYNKLEDLLGLGPAAFGYVNQYMYINKGDLNAYFKSAGEGEFPILVGKKATKMDQMRGAMAKGLRNYKVDKILFYKLFNCYPEDVFKQEIQELLDDDLIEITDSEIKLTDRGGVWGNNVSKIFFEHPETFEWRASLAKGRVPQQTESEVINNINLEKFRWENGIKELFEKLLERKPVFIRNKARIDISNIAANLAQHENRTIITEKDVVLAALKDTPAPFRPTAINGFKKLGVNVEKYIDKINQL